MSALVGATINGGGAGQPSLQAAITYWESTLNLPLQCSKFFIAAVGTYPTTIGTTDQTFINNGIAFIPCFKPTYPVVAAEVNQLISSVNMWTGAGANIPCVVLYSEVNSGNAVTGPEYIQIVQAFQNVRATVPLYIDFAGAYQGKAAPYWQQGLFDGVGVDFYTNSYSPNNLTIDFANNYAIQAGVPLGLFEFGNNRSLLNAAPFPAYMNYLTGVFQTRASNGQPPGPCMWWESTGPGAGDSFITPSTGGPADPRIPYLNAFFAAVNAGTMSPYDVGDVASGASGTTLTLTVGTGALGSPKGSNAGDLVYALISSALNSLTITGVTDSKSNVYTQQNSFSSPTTKNSQWLWVSKTTTALVAGTDTITVTFSGGTPTNKSMIVRACPGVASATADQAVIANGNSASPTVTSASLTSSAELVVGGIANGSLSAAPTGIPFGTPETLKQLNNITLFDEKVTSTAPITASGTITSDVWSASVTTFKLTSGVPSITTPASLVSGVVGTAYSATETATGGTKPYTWQTTAVTGAFPTGLSLSSSGTFSGTPSAAGTFTFTVKVTDALSNATTSSTQTIVIAAGALTVTTGALPSGTTGTAYSTTETESGGTSPFTWALSSGSLPPGLSISSAGVISGTPTTVGTYTFVVQVTDATSATALSGTQTITINPPGGVSGAIAAIGIDVAGVSQSGHDKAVVAHGSSTAPSVASGTLAQAEEQCIGFISDVTAGGNPTWAAPWSSNVLATQADGGSHLIISAAYQTVTATTSVTASGTITSDPWSAAVITYAVNAPNLLTVLSNGVQGDPYSQTLETSGGLGTYTYAITSGSLPPGLTLASGVISGTPTTPGTYTFTLTATDAHSFSSALAENVTIVVVGASPATAAPMTGNILTQADSDFESGVGSWVAQTNASGITTSPNAALTGAHSLRWSSTADGSTSVKTGVYTGIVGGKPYIVSGYVLATSNQAPNLWIGVNWYTSGGTFISSTNNGGSSLLNPQWQGVHAALTAPANAAKAEVFVTVDASNAGDLNYLDLMFFTQTTAQVLIDFVNPAFGTQSQAGGSFADVSPWVRMDQGLSLGRGRQDAISEVSTGQGSFALQNDSGWFTPGNQNSVAVAMGGQVTLQARCQVNLTDETGAWHTRFDGQVAQIGYAIDPSGNTNLATITLADVLAALSRQDNTFAANNGLAQQFGFSGTQAAGLRSWSEEQALAYGPSYHWSLTDTPNVSGELYTLASESSGNGGPPLKLVRSALSVSATIAWGDTSAGVETLADAFAPGEPDGSAYWSSGPGFPSRLPSSALRGLDSGAIGPFSVPVGSVLFTPQLTAGSALNNFTSNAGYHLQAQLPALLNPNVTPNGDFAVEAWFMPDPSVVANVAANYGPYTVFSLGSAKRGASCLVAGVFQPGSGNIPAAGMASYSGAPAFGAKNFGGTVTPTAHAYAALIDADTVKRPHHLVVNVQGDPSAPTATVYVDGVSNGSFALPAGTTFDTITVGGAFGGTGCFFGNISSVSIYPFQLNGGQITLNCQLGQYGMWELPTDDCIAQLCNYANLPVFWNNISAQHNGLSLTDYYSIAGNNAYTAMTVYEQTEQGLLFVNAAGQLTFHTRDWRMGYGAPKLNLPPDSYSEQLGLGVLDTYQTNENAVGSVAFPGGASYVNQGSQTQYGTYATNPVGSPVQLAHISYSRGFGQAGLQEATFWPDPNMTDAAAWSANAKASPWFTIGSITVDMLTVDPTWGVNISNLYGVEVDDVLSLSSVLPASLPNASHANEYFIEGVSETYVLPLQGQPQRQITFYVSPAATQRAWIPGDPAYGVLSQTARLGISASDTSTPQADGKDVSHDGGPPFWAPTVNATMNSPAGNQGFVGMNDMRGLTWPLQQMLTPPLLSVQASNNSQTLASGQNDTPQVFWDTLNCDSANGMGIIPGWPNWYVCLQPGFYEIDASVVWANASSGAGLGCMGWIVVAMGAAQVVATGASNPTTAPQYVCPIGETVRQNTVTKNACSNPTTRLYLGLGDMITVAAEHDTGVSAGTTTSNNGSRLSVRFVGLGTVDDRIQLNSSINGGTVTNPVPITHGTKVYQNQHTFAHYGQHASLGASQLINKDGFAYQGTFGSAAATVGSRFTLVRFPWQQMFLDLNGKNLTSVTLKGTNNATTYPTGATLLGGYYYTNNEGAAWAPNSQNPGPQKGVWTQFFKQGQTVTFSLPAAQFEQMFIKNGAHGIMLGDNLTLGWAHAGRWNGGPNSWTLTVSY